MRVMLIGAELEENLALRYLAAALESKGHQAVFAAFANAKDTEDVVALARQTRPDVIGMSMTFQFRAAEFGALAGELRKAGVRGHITVGGHFPTFAYREVLESFPAIDSVVRHEGEETLPELCGALAAPGASLASVRGLVFRGADGAILANETRPLLSNLDAVPFAKRFGPPQLHLGIPSAFLVGSRGCYGHCTFCCIQAYLKSSGGPKYRMRSAENIADEMAALRRDRGARMFVFHDDDFFTRDAAHDLARMTSLRDALRRRGLNDIAIVVKARPDDVDPRVFAVLGEIGLLRVYLGIESGSTQGLRVLGRGVDLAENQRALSYLRENDIYTCYNMLVFDPESTIKGLRQSFDFVRRNADVPMNFCRTEIYVGTPLMTKLGREGRLIGDVFGWDYQISEPAAERAFRLFADVFLDRNFRCDGLMNSSLGLGYHLHLLKHFYPRAMTSDLRAKVHDATVAVNLDSVDRMVRILDFAASPASLDGAATDDFRCRLSEETDIRSKQLEDRLSSVTDAIYRAAFPPVRASRPARWQALSAAAVALVPIATGAEGCSNPPPPDPLPVPVTIYDTTTGTDAAGDSTSSTTSDTTPQPVDPVPPPQTNKVPPPPPTDPLPPPTSTWKKPPPPPDPLPPPTTTNKKPPPPPPPPDPLPPPKTKF